MTNDKCVRVLRSFFSQIKMAFSFETFGCYLLTILVFIFQSHFLTFRIEKGKGTPWSMSWILHRNGNFLK